MNFTFPKEAVDLIIDGLMCGGRRCLHIIDMLRNDCAEQIKNHNETLAALKDKKEADIGKSK